MAAKNFYSLLAVACMALLSLYSRPTMACSCAAHNVREVFCSSEYFVRAVVLSKLTQQDENIAYTIRVKYSYKMTSKGEEILQNSVLVTPAQSKPCALNLEVGKVYVIAGKTGHLDLCNTVKDYDNMSMGEKIGLQLLPKFPDLC